MDFVHIRYLRSYPPLVVLGYMNILALKEKGALHMNSPPPKQNEYFLEIGSNDCKAFVFPTMVRHSVSVLMGGGGQPRRYSRGLHETNRMHIFYWDIFLSETTKNCVNFLAIWNNDKKEIVTLVRC
jgi:hypothetical protein